jgi:hypothetical protein
MFRYLRVSVLGHSGAALLDLVDRVGGGCLRPSRRNSGRPATRRQSRYVITVRQADESDFNISVLAVFEKASETFTTNLQRIGRTRLPSPSADGNLHSGGHLPGQRVRSYKLLPLSGKQPSPAVASGLTRTRQRIDALARDRRSRR